MGYIESNLMPKEHVIVFGKVHWWIFTPGLILLALGIVLMFMAPLAGSILLLGCLILFLKAWLYASSTELAITNKRVIAKFGFIKRTTFELLHNKVESLHVEQSVFGRLMNFGTITVCGTGGAQTPIPGIRSPLAFRMAAQASIDNYGK